MVNRRQLTYNEIMVVLDIKCFSSESTDYALPPGLYEKSDNNKTVQNFLPDFVKVSVSFDNIRLKSIFYIIQTLIFTEKSFFYTKLGFTQSNSGSLGYIDGYIQLIPGKYKIFEPINVTGVEKVHLKADCIMGSIANGARNPIL